MGSKENTQEIFITAETMAVVEHYLQKTQARRAKRLAKKASLKPKDKWDPKTGKFYTPGDGYEPEPSTVTLPDKQAAKPPRKKKPVKKPAPPKVEKPREVWNPRTGKFTVIE